VTVNSLRTPGGSHRSPNGASQHRPDAGGRDERRIRLRPHSKTLKSPVIAKWQIDRGAIGICCAKLGEAEVFAERGISDIRLPTRSTRRTPTASSRCLIARIFRSWSTTGGRTTMVRRDDARRAASRRAGQGRCRFSSVRHRP
jgi:hypothetical protein